MNQDNSAFIEERAYFIWEEQGRPPDAALNHWLRALAEFEAKPNPKPF